MPLRGPDRVVHDGIAPVADVVRDLETSMKIVYWDDLDDYGYYLDTDYEAADFAEAPPTTSHLYYMPDRRAWIWG